MVVKAFRSVVIAVSDRERALNFYRDLLGFSVLAQARGSDSVQTVLDAGAGHTLTLLSDAGTARPSRWLPNDLQTGLRHVGFRTRDVDATTARLKAAGVPFTLDPLDATGGVRIAFFTDPDGTLLEIVQGELEYHAKGSAAGQTTPVTPEGDSLIFDHVAVSVSNLDDAQAFYGGQLGCPVIGQLFFNDQRGFTITYLKAGTAVLELFSFSAPTLPNYHDADPAVVGLKHPVLEVAALPDSDRTMLTGLDSVQLELVPSSTNGKA